MAESTGQHWLAFDGNWFNRHQRALLFLANHWLFRRWFRWILRIHNSLRTANYRAPIHRLEPQSVHYFHGFTREGLPQYQAEYYSHDKFSKRLYHAFKPLWWAIHYWDELIADRWVPRWSYGFDSLTVYPSAGTNAYFDGYIRSSDSSYNEARAGYGTSGSVTADHSSSTISCENYNWWDGGQEMHDLARVWLRFNTSTLPDNAVVSAATVELARQADPASSPSSGNRLLRLFESTISTGSTSLSASNWAALNATQLATEVDCVLWSSGTGYYGWTLNSTGRGLISPTGMTQYCIRATHDVNGIEIDRNNQPPYNVKIAWKSADTTGTSSDPKLVITYTAAQTVSPSGFAVSATFGSAVRSGLNTIAPSGMSAGQAVGTATISQSGGLQTVSPSGLSDTQDFGTATLSPGAVSVAPSGISDGQDFGTAALAPGAVSVAPSGIASAVALGSPVLSALAVITPSGLAAGQSFGTAVLTPGGVAILVTGISAGQTFGTATIGRGAVSVLPSGIVSTVALGSPVVSALARLLPSGIASTAALGSAVVNGLSTLLPSGIAAGQTFGTAALTVGAVSILPTGIAATVALGSPALSSIAVIAPSGISDGQDFGAATIAALYSILPSGISAGQSFGTAVLTPGGVVVAPSGLSVGQTFGNASLSSLATVLASGIAPTIDLGNPVLSALAVIAPSGWGNSQIFGTALVTPGEVAILPGGIDPSIAFGSHVIGSGGAVISPEGIAATVAAGTPVLSVGAVAIAPGGFESGQSFGTAVLTPGGVLIVPAGIDAGPAFGTAILTPGGVVIAPSGLAPTVAVGDPLISSGGYTVAPEGISDGQDFGSAVISPGGVAILPSGIDAAAAFGVPVLSALYSIFPEGIASGEAFGTPVLTLVTVVQPAGLASELAFGLAIVSRSGVVIPLSIDSRTLAPTWLDIRSLQVTWIDSRVIALPETTMTVFNETLKDIVIGDDRRIQRTYSTLPEGVTVSKAWLTIKKRPADADVDALIQKTITASLTDSGQITDASTASGSIALYFDLDTTDTDGMPTRKPCHYDIQIKTSDGDVHTLEVGTVTFVQGITVSIS